MRRALAAALAVLAFTAGVVASAVEHVSAATAADGEEAELYRLTNEARAASGLPALGDDRLAAAVARDWARTMADGATLRHNPDLAQQVTERVTRDWTRLGENVGVGPGARPIHDAFMASSGHRGNVLGDYNRVGVGAARSGDGRLWVTVVFLKAPAPAPASASPASWAPFPSPEAFAEQQYRDFLGRLGDAPGVGHWASVLRSGAMTGAQVVAEFLGSSEFGGLMSPVVRLYFGAFARIPDQPGLQSWLDTRRRGASLPAIADSFAATPEFRGAYDRYDNRAFVDALYRRVFGRPADPAGLDHWGGGLDAGRLSRGGVLLGVTGSGEFVSSASAEVSATMAYVGLLRRTPDAGGFAAAVRDLDAGRPFTALLGAVLGSDEYRARF